MVYASHEDTDGKDDNTSTTLSEDESMENALFSVEMDEEFQVMLDNQEFDSFDDDMFMIEEQKLIDFDKALTSMLSSNDNELKKVFFCSPTEFISCDRPSMPLTLPRDLPQELEDLGEYIDSMPMSQERKSSSLSQVIDNDLQISVKDSEVDTSDHVVLDEDNGTTPVSKSETSAQSSKAPRH